MTQAEIYTAVPAHLPKNFPFYNWVPKPLGIAFLVILFIPIMTVSGAYSVNSSEMVGGLGIQSEHIAFISFVTSIGMAAFSPFFYQLVCVRRQKMMSLVGFSILAVQSYICANTDSLFILALNSLIMGFVRQTLLMCNLFTLIKYGFGIEATRNVSPGNEPSDEAGWDTSAKVELFGEVLSFSYESKDEKLRKAPLIDTRTEELFAPRAKRLELVGDEKDNYMDLLVTKRLTKATSRSFVFSREMINQYRKNCKNEIYMKLIEGIYSYGIREMFIVNTEKIGLISLDALPLAFKYKKNNSETVGNVLLSLNGPALIPENMYGVVENVIDNMNIVLEQLVPGLRIGVVDLGLTMAPDGKISKQIQLMSLKNNKEIPFRYESEGIKKIVSILQLLIVVYNNPSITVAVDELDGGVFEYLLGEILSIISEKGKGQLIFTSHNLRPLETIDKGFIAFTTTNPYNRYIRLTNVKGTNNLRDFYYRDIVLGEQSEQVYNPTNNYEIALAFREAGEALGS